MCPSNIHVFTYKTIYTGICTPKWTKMPEFYASHFCGALDIFLWRTTFCGAPGSGAPQNYCGWVLPSYFCGAPGWVRHRKLIFLWRMDPCATEKNLVATILWRTQQTWGCATEF